MIQTDKTNRLDALFAKGKKDLLNIFFTAGYPGLNDTVPILQALQSAGADMVEIGMPYSDPLADGPTIQHSSEVAIRNGMNLSLLFEQVREARKTVQLPLIFMGYLNQMMQYGTEKFLAEAAKAGVDAMIIPDLPMEIYEKEYQALFQQYGIRASFLISPRTSEARIHKAAELSDGFVYMVADSSTTGAKSGISAQQIKYFERIQAMNLKSPRLIGFGISSHESFARACAHAEGAIIGSAFIKTIGNTQDLNSGIHQFIQSIRS